MTAHAPELIGTDRETGRELHYAAAADPHRIGEVDMPSPHWVCLLLWDASGVPSKAVADLARAMLRSGCVYLCAWGEDCERVHDIFDEVSLDEDPDLSRGTIMTAWIRERGLEEALWFFLRNTMPDDDYSATCFSSLVLTIGDGAAHADTIRDALADPDGFVRRVLDEK